MTKPPRMTDEEIKAEAARHVAEYRATTMIERVAGAIALVINFPGKFGDDPTDQAIAVAAITAMREPTRGMVKAGDPHTNCGGCCGNRAGEDTWKAMIDAALEEKP